MEKAICPVCGAESEPGLNFCAFCGSALEQPELDIEITEVEGAEHYVLFGETPDVKIAEAINPLEDSSDVGERVLPLLPQAKLVNPEKTRVCRFCGTPVPPGEIICPACRNAKYDDESYNAELKNPVTDVYEGHTGMGYGITSIILDALAVPLPILLLAAPVFALLGMKLAEKAHSSAADRMCYGGLIGTPIAALLSALLYLFITLLTMTAEGRI